MCVLHRASSEERKKETFEKRWIQEGRRRGEKQEGKGEMRKTGGKEEEGKGKNRHGRREERVVRIRRMSKRIKM